eukprot:gb/GFBE01009948.1/.p1 GENE.gb/GFBE01009948.1/~~gb/GFBE01009948.1/.p1  ORF type:complete len:129 (+),score=47.76 gb/GFBE01009948.1/:1-387(+)
MAKSSLTTLCVLAAMCCMVLRCSLAFLPAAGRTSPALRGDAALVAGAAAASIPDGAEAFVYNGKEYFDRWFGIEPLAWATCGFSIVYFGAVVKNAAQKYNKPVGIRPVKVGKFLGKEVENEVIDYRAK